MKIHLNEKLWFGKYKDSKLIDVINTNPSYITKMLQENNISLNDDALEYMKNITKKKNNNQFGNFLTTVSYTMPYDTVRLD